MLVRAQVEGHWSPLQFRLEFAVHLFGESLVQDSGLDATVAAERDGDAPCLSVQDQGHAQVVVRVPKGRQVGDGRGYFKD